MDFQGRRLGGALPIDAVKRRSDAGIAALAMIVDTKNDDAVAFYEHSDFKRFEDLEQKLFLPIGDGLKRLLQQFPATTRSQAGLAVNLQNRNFRSLRENPEQYGKGGRLAVRFIGLTMPQKL